MPVPLVLISLGVLAAGHGLPEAQAEVVGKAQQPRVSEAIDFPWDSSTAAGSTVVQTRKAAAPISVYFSAALQYLDDANGDAQQIFTGFAFLAGIFMITDGEKSFKYLIVLLVAASVSLNVFSNLEQTWDAPKLWHTVGGLEAGLLAGIIVWYGYEGSQLMMGAALGLFIGYRLQTWLGERYPQEQTMPAAVVIISTLCVVLGGSAFTYFRKQTLRFIASIMGGCLVASAAGFAVTALVRKNELKLQEAGFVALHAEGNTWIDFLRALFGMASKHVGILSNYHFGHGVDMIKGEVVLFGHHIDMDQVLGIMMWIFVARIGINMQKNKMMTANAREVRSPLVEPLLIKD